MDRLTRIARIDGRKPHDVNIRDAIASYVDMVRSWVLGLSSDHDGNLVEVSSWLHLRCTRIH
jgi:hypothetical protein